jgi:hypothetical protein
MFADYLTFTQVVEIFSLVTALLIAGFSFRTYLLTRQRKHEFFAVAFLLIAFGIALNTVFNTQVQLQDLVIPFQGALAITSTSGVLLFSSMFLGLAGFLTIFLITEEVFNRKMIALTFVFALLTTLLAMDYYAVFYVVNFIVLAMVFGHFYRNFHVHSTTTSLLVMLAFGFLAISQIPFSLTFVDFLFYQLGTIIRLVSFVLFLTALILIFKPRRSKLHARA